MIILMSIASGTSLYAQDATGVRRNLERMYGKVETIGIECYLVEHANKQGVFDKYGKEIVPFNGDYWEIKWNSKSKCFEATSHKKDSKGDLLAAVYNQKGGVVVPPGGYMLKYKDDSSPFDSYEVSAKINDKWTYGYYNLKGEMLLPPFKYVYKPTYNDNIGGAVVESLDGYYGLVAKGGRVAIPADRYTDMDIVWNAWTILASYKVKKDGVVSYLNPALYDKNGNVLVPEGKYDRIFYSSLNKQEYLKDGKCLKVSKGGEWSTITPGRIWRLAGGKIGLIDGKTGKPILDLVEGSQLDWPDFPTGDILVFQINEQGDTTSIDHYSPNDSFIFANGSPSDNSVAESQNKKTESKPVQNGGAANKPSLPSDVDVSIPKTTRSNTDTYVFIVANENYPQRSVPFAINDGKIFKQYCENTLGIQSNHIRFYSDATSANLIACVEQMKQASIANSGQLSIIFYYAGHAFPDEQTKSAYLLPVDGQTNLLRTCYSLNSLYKELSALKAKNITCFIDACFSGTTRENEMLLAGRGVAIKVKEDVPRGNVVVFTSATGDETAHQYKEKKHGLFTYYLLKKLKESKGNVTLGELGDYITTNVKRTSFDVNNKIQTPTVIPSATMIQKWRNIKL